MSEREEVVVDDRGGGGRQRGRTRVDGQGEQEERKDQAKDGQRRIEVGRRAPGGEETSVGQGSEDRVDQLSVCMTGFAM